MDDVKIHAKKKKKHLRVWLQGNENAILMCLQLVRVSNLWDDLIDKDKDIKDEDINTVFTDLLVNLPLNPFYVAFQRDIAPMMNNIILKWHTANVFEKEQKENDLEKAYMLRAEYYQLFVLCANLIGGSDWAREVSVQIWRLYGESVKSLTKEIKNG